MSESVTQVSVDCLFEPYTYGSLELANRIVMAPMTRGMCPEYVPTDDVVAYYRRRAEGGVGLIITEGTPPNDQGHGWKDVPSFYGQAALDGWKRVADAVHEAGGKIMPQIWHTGAMRQPGMGPVPELSSAAPTAFKHPGVRDQENCVASVAMTQADIDETVAAFAASAANAKKLGFDGIELHGAHSYLIDQFFWEFSNSRTDGYGGDLPQRTRFAVEVVEAVRAEVGPEFPVILRFSQWKQGDYDHKMAPDADALAAFLAPLSAAGVDIFHASNRRFGDPEFEGSELNLAGWCKKLTGKPAITVGSVGLDSDFLRSYAGKEAHQAGLDDLVRRVEAGEFELVAVGRALLSDPAWANKVRDGRESEIVSYAPEHMGVLT